MSKDNNTNERLLLLLSDVLGDLKIGNKDGALWTPESLQKALAKKGGGLDLVSDLVKRLQKLIDSKNDVIVKPVESWNGLLKGYPTLCPPWVSFTDLAHKPLVSKLEILSFLASTLQNRLLKTSKASAASQSGENDSGDSLSLPSHFTKEQRETVQLCHQAMKADYNKRRVGMKQRLDILVSNFEADDTDMTDIKQKLKNISLSSALPADLSEADLLEHFTTPHSKDLGPRTPQSGANNPLENLTVVDRGGRTDEAESRISKMPEWSS